MDDKNVCTDSNLNICVDLSALHALRLSHQSQFVFHHCVWLTHHFTLGWICRETNISVVVAFRVNTSFNVHIRGKNGSLTTEEVLKADGLVAASQRVESQV